MATTTRVLSAAVSGTVYTADANGALEAIDTCHSGATAPTDELANGKFWLDTTTTPAILKVYNNAAWEVAGSRFPDSEKALFGDSGELEIYSNGTNSFITESGSGNFYIEGDNIFLRNAAGTEDYASFVSNGAANFSFNNLTKLSTTGSGIDITGGFEATDGSTITVDDNSVALGLVCTDTDSSIGPILRLSRDATGVDGRLCGAVQFYAKNDAGTNKQYGFLRSTISSATAGAEYGDITISALYDGTTRVRAEFTDTEAAFNPIGLDIDFRVESANNTHALMIDAATDKIGMFNAAPAALLHIGDATNSLGSSSGDELDNLIIQSDVTHNDQLKFSSQRVAAGTGWGTAAQRIQRKVDTTEMGYIQFGNHSSDVVTMGKGASNELFELDNTGNITATSFTGQLLPVYTATAPFSAGVTSVSHGLGRVPTLWKVVLQCLTANNGYAVGDEIDITNMVDGDGTRGYVSYANATTIKYSANQAAIQNSAANYILPTTTHWQFEFRAW